MTTRVRLVVDPDLAPLARAVLGAAGRCVVAPDEWRDPADVVAVDATSPPGVRAAVLLALRDGSLLATATPTTRPSLVADLGDLGAVAVWCTGASDLPPVARLTAEQARILAALAAGASTTDAAAAVHLSGRSTERRLQQARQVLGVATVAEAVVALGRAADAWR